MQIEFSDQITVICGKNGTSKSSILGIAAQIFSFEKDYVKDERISIKQITGSSFKSQYSEHFRISEKFDTPGSMLVNIELHDGYTNKEATAKLELMKRGKSPRAVVRNNSTASKDKNPSRNFTHPVIFLSLKRLFPIADRKYKVISLDYLQKNKQQFIALANELLNRQSSLATSTEGTISSTVAHGDNYDQESVSAGEDNAGQIVLALMSFRRLKKEYVDYKGGLLLIDEADAGLFPTAQINLLRILERECRELNLQVIMTSHSPTLIEYAYQQSQQYRQRYKTIYLSDTFGSVKVMQDWSWEQVIADINTKIIEIDKNRKLPKINIYFEDREAADFFSAIVNRQPIRKFINPLPEISLGCSNYLQLIKKGIVEFSEKSIICLDADVKDKKNLRNTKTIIYLPGSLPPDQLIFEYLYNLPPDNDFWKNDLQFTRDVFTNCSSDIIREFAISGNTVDIKQSINAYSGNKTPREIFKKFYKSKEFQEITKTISRPYNPWNNWVINNQDACNTFLSNLQQTLQTIMSSNYSISANELSMLKIKVKGN